MIWSMRVVVSLILFSSVTCAQEVVVIDHVGTDHSRQRQTTITKVKAMADGRVSYRIERKIFGSGHVHYSKSDQGMYMPPVKVREIWLYPARYSYQQGIDQEKQAPALVSFDESVEIDLVGYDVDEILGRAADEEISKEVTLEPRKRTEASLGITVVGLEEREVKDPAPYAKWSRLLASLGEQKGFVGQRVEKVVPAGPADRAGIKPDDLIVDVNGAMIDRDRKLQLVEDYLPVNKAAKITVARRDRGGSIGIYTIDVMPERRELLSAH